jgi:hypothetical protein
MTDTPPRPTRRRVLRAGSLVLLLKAPQIAWGAASSPCACGRPPTTRA